MAKAHTWHPGQTALGSFWAIPIHLLPDESISSYIVRAATAHGTSPASLAAWLWPDWRAWTTDVDRGLPSNRLRTLATHSGIDSVHFLRAAIRPAATQIEGQMPDANKGWRWILSRAAAGSRTGQYCPLCLTDGNAPYYRLQWRLAWHTGCRQHGNLLCDCCTACGSAVRPHRLSHTAPHAARCSQCHADLREAKTVPGNRHALDFQNAADNVLQDGRGACFGLPVSVRDWFATAGFFANLLRRAARQQTPTMNKLLELLGARSIAPGPAVPGARIERLPTGDREWIATEVWRIMGRSAEELQTAVNESGISRQGWADKGGSMPAPIATLLPNLPDNGRTKYVRKSKHRCGPRSRNEVIRMAKRLERTLQSEQR